MPVWIKSKKINSIPNVEIYELFLIILLYSTFQKKVNENINDVWTSCKRFINRFLKNVNETKTFKNGFLKNRLNINRFLLKRTFILLKGYDLLIFCIIMKTINDKR